MAPNDADMAARQGLSDDMDQIAKDMAGLRADLQGLTGDVKRLGGHQIENMQDTANAALEEIAAAVRRNPLTAVAIAIGAGFIYGVLTRRWRIEARRRPTRSGPGTRRSGLRRRARPRSGRQACSA